MPLDRYYDGKGEKVMRAMQAEYGAKKGDQVFYATANKRKKKLKRPTASLSSYGPSDSGAGLAKSQMQAKRRIGRRYGSPFERAMQGSTRLRTT